MSVPTLLIVKMRYASNKKNIISTTLLTPPLHIGERMNKREKMYSIFFYHLVELKANFYYCLT